MKVTRLLWDMPITVAVEDTGVTEADINKIYEYFTEVDKIFSTFKADSEMSQINRGEIKPEDASTEMKEVLKLSEQTRQETGGYFDIHRDGQLDPLGLVKGWAVQRAAEKLRKMGYNRFFIDAGGDIQTAGKNWIVGIRNPFNRKENVQIMKLWGEGIATSGTYIRGQHVVNPKKPGGKITDIVSLSVIGPNVYEADRMATAAFAMGKKGIEFISRQPQLSGYMIDINGVATMTPGWKKYAAN